MFKKLLAGWSWHHETKQTDGIFIFLPSGWCHDAACGLCKKSFVGLLNMYILVCIWNSGAEGIGACLGPWWSRRQLNSTPFHFWPHPHPPTILHKNERKSTQKVRDESILCFTYVLLFLAIIIKSNLSNSSLPRKTCRNYKHVLFMKYRL